MLANDGRGIAAEIKSVMSARQAAAQAPDGSRRAREKINLRWVPPWTSRAADGRDADPFHARDSSMGRSFAGRSERSSERRRSRLEMLRTRDSRPSNVAAHAALIKPDAWRSPIARILKTLQLCTTLALRCTPDNPATSGGVTTVSLAKDSGTAWKCRWHLPVQWCPPSYFFSPAVTARFRRFSGGGSGQVACGVKEHGGL